MFKLGHNHRLIAALCCFVAVVALLSASAVAQHFTPATAANAKQFVGVWKASFQGKPFLTVTIAIDGNKVAGNVSHADLELNDAGELTKAEANDAEPPDPITDARVNGDTLRITTKSTNGSEDSIQADIKLVANNEADLRMVVPPDAPAPKPWHLERVAAKH